MHIENRNTYQTQIENLVGNSWDSFSEKIKNPEDQVELENRLLLLTAQGNAPETFLAQAELTYRKVKDIAIRKAESDKSGQELLSLYNLLDANVYSTSRNPIIYNINNEDVLTTNFTRKPEENYNESGNRLRVNLGEIEHGELSASGLAYLTDAATIKKVDISPFFSVSPIEYISNTLFEMRKDFSTPLHAIKRFWERNVKDIKDVAEKRLEKLAEIAQKSPEEWPESFANSAKKYKEGRVASAMVLIKEKWKDDQEKQKMIDEVSKVILARYEFMKLVGKINYLYANSYSSEIQNKLDTFSYQVV